MEEFITLPILGRKTDVPADSPAMFKAISENVVATHDAGGLNFDITRKRNVCTKSHGSVEWSSSATAQATKCQGLFELDDGTNRDHCYWDNGKFYVYDGNLDPADKTAGGVTHLQGDENLICAIRVGSHVVFAGKGWDGGTGDTPYAWKYGDANAAKLISGGTEYQFRYLVYFMRRIIGLYSDQTNGDIDIRWCGALPTPTSSCEFAAANQLWVPNDDPIVGVGKMGTDKCFVYSEDSIHQMAYVQDYDIPFRIFTIVPHQGCTGHNSIVNLGNYHLFFNPNYGFVMYSGGKEVLPISDDIIPDVQAIDSDYYDLIVGTFIPFTKEAVWAVPAAGAVTPTQLWFFNTETKQWRFENKAMRFVDHWRMKSNYTWLDLIEELGGMDKASGTADADSANELVDSGADFITAGVTTNDQAFNITDGKFANITSVAATTLGLDKDAFPDGDEVYKIGDGATWSRAGLNRWGRYLAMTRRLVYSNTDGKAYYQSGEDTVDGYRIEPMMDFGNPNRHDLLKEIWFRFTESLSFNVHSYHRGGNTPGEVEGASWTALPDISHNSPAKPCVHVAQSARIHQIKWRTDAADEKFANSQIRYKYEPQTEI